MKSFRPLAAFWLFALSPSLFAAPPPELTILRQQYDKAYAERVTAPFDASKAALETKFAGALDNAIATAKASGDLPAVLAIQEDKKAIEAKQDLPADTDSTPAALKTLRAIYREQIAKLTEQRTANATALLAPYTAKLQALEATLTKNDRVEEAKDVMDYRTALKAEAPPQQPAMAATPAAPTTPASPTTTATGTAQKAAAVKGDDRKAAEWVLSVGGTVALKGANKTVVNLDELPKGRFSVSKINLDNNNGAIKPFNEADFQAIAGLEGLTNINLNKLPVSSAIFATVATCPNLESISNQYNRFGDGIWAHLAPLQKLNYFGCQYDALKPTGVGISQLSKSSIRSLDLNSLPITDEGLAEIAHLTELEHVGLESAKITDAGIRSLVSLKKLQRLYIHNTAITTAGLAPLKPLPITSLGFGRTASELAVQAAELAGIFPNLTVLQLPRDCIPTPEDWKAIATAFPKLERISFDSQPFKDEHLAGVEAFSNIQELYLHYAKLTDAGVITLSKLKKLFWLHLYEAQITDAALETLAGMKSLKRVKLPKPGNGLTADGLAKLKKQRPDMKVE